MQIFRLYILVGLTLLYIIIPLIGDSTGAVNNSITSFTGFNKGMNLAISSQQIDNQDPIELIQPDSASQVTTFTPTFAWHAIKADTSIEYRLLISKIDGKIIYDEWVGPDTSHTVSSPGKFEDLNPYYWSVYASSGDQQVQSPLWSFWVDQEVVTDLTVSNIFLEEEKGNWNPGDEIKIQATIQNSGPVNAEGCFVTLYSGNMNRNYFNYAAHRKTIALDTVFVPALKMNYPRSVTLSARLPAGFNHFFVRIDPVPGMKDVIYSNNYTNGIKIQTEDRVLSLKGLFVIYTRYSDPEVGEKRLGEKDIDKLQENIFNFQHYFWNHTHIIQIHVDTLQIERLLSDNDFTFQDNKWGYFFAPGEVNTDLIQPNFTEIGYDFIFVYYSWWNSKSSWSGYSGYTLKDAKFLNKKLPFLAQPVTAGNIEDEKTAIHEFIHLLDNLYDISGERQFYSPHHRALYTTFDSNNDYFEWILETWPTDRWINLKVGQLLHRKDAAWLLEQTTISSEPKTLILSQNYPNPFNKMTTIIYRIPQLHSASTGIKVRLVIYDILGNQIRVLRNSTQNSGTYRIYWDGKDQQGNPVSSGIYFYELKAGNQRQVKKLLYLR